MASKNDKPLVHLMVQPYTRVFAVEELTRTIYFDWGDCAVCVIVVLRRDFPRPALFSREPTFLVFTSAESSIRRLIVLQYYGVCF